MRHTAPAAAAIALLLGACAETNAIEPAGTPVPQPVAQPAPAPAPSSSPQAPASVPEPQPAPDTTPEQAAALDQASSSGGGRLGETVGSLGDATEPGLWIETAFVDSVQQGRIENAGTGQSANVELRPLGSEGGSRLSIAAMQGIGASLTDLPDVVVYSD